MYQIEIIRKIGSGGMGEVYEADLLTTIGHETIRTRVAVKKIKSDFTNQDTIQAVVNEARISMQLNHPNILPIKSIVEQDGTMYLVMDLLEGLTLSQIIDHGSKNKIYLPESILSAILKQSLSALQYAHNLSHRGQSGQKYIIHRDISPHNIFLTKDGHIKILDFGIAKLFDKNEALTQTQTLKGKLSYLAPELFDGQQISPAIDYYSLGLTLYELATSSKLFQSSSDLEIIKQKATYKIPPLKSIRSDLSDTFCNFIDQLLSQKPEARMSHLNHSTYINRLSSQIEHEDLEQTFRSQVSYTTSTMTHPKVIQNFRRWKLPDFKKIAYIAGIVICVIAGYLSFFRSNKDNKIPKLIVEYASKSYDIRPSKPEMDEFANSMKKNHAAVTCMMLCEQKLIDIALFWHPNFYTSSEEKKQTLNFIKNMKDSDFNSYIASFDKLANQCEYFEACSQMYLQTMHLVSVIKTNDIKSKDTFDSYSKKLQKDVKFSFLDYTTKLYMNGYQDVYTQKRALESGAKITNMTNSQTDIGINFVEVPVEIFPKDTSECFVYADFYLNFMKSSNRLPSNFEGAKFILHPKDDSIEFVGTKNKDLIFKATSRSSPVFKEGVCYFETGLNKYVRHWLPSIGN